MKYYLAIDIGASSGRHILGWIENGIMKTEEIYRFSNLPDTVGEHLKWNEKRLFQEILNGLKKAGELGKIPYSVGIDTWGVDYALLDENDEAGENEYDEDEAFEYIYDAYLADHVQDDDEDMVIASLLNRYMELQAEYL